MIEELFDFKNVEAKWQKLWEENKIFSAAEKNDQIKFYVLEMFPYPSGKIHMGHVRNYVIGDVIARYKWSQGFNVLHPIGWDAFGLPAENAAMKNNVTPAEWTYSNIVLMRKSLKSLGISYDWQREFATCDQEYYRWNQWFFLQFYKMGLVYRKKSLVNWCPSCQTVLANEQVSTGRCWRCNSAVLQKELEQWYFRITAYTEELLSDHKLLEKTWPQRVLLMQNNWIGKSWGVEVDFSLVENRGNTRPAITVFTTRADTLFGATYLVVSPEHPLLKDLTSELAESKKVEEFVRKTLNKKRSALGIEEKEGVFTGRYALNPLTEEKIPIWIANYVLMEYGSGAIMAVPAHDQRDFEFAQKYNLDIREVVVPEEKKDFPVLESAFVDDGQLVNSGEFSGLTSEIARQKITAFLESKGIGKPVINYRFKDWLISRQRYWGTPIPVIYCSHCGVVPLPEKDLPVVLPKNVQLTGKGESPLASVPEFVEVNCPQCQRPARRETDTMDTFVDSSWYYARYTDAQNGQQPFAPEKARYWLPVDQYVGGIEHACMHLIYARFFHKVMRDLGLLTKENREPFRKLLTQGMVTLAGSAMSKSRGNIIEPAAILEKYGADTLRIFILFASPPERDLEWSDQGVEGAWRFLNRVWRLVKKMIDNQGENAQSGKVEVKAGAQLLSTAHHTIRKVTDDLENQFQFNTALARIMELVNAIYLYPYLGDSVSRQAVEIVIRLLAPITPHLSEEAWQQLGKKGNILRQRWPDYDPNKLVVEELTIIIQGGGKLWSKVQLPAQTPDEEIKSRALADPKVQERLKNKKIKQIIYIEKKLVNIVTE
ncbi:MAG: leucine--tRNA ligase [Elusimicrobiota bacterium]